MSADEIQEKLDEEIRHDDYEWNKILKGKVQRNGKDGPQSAPSPPLVSILRFRVSMRGDGDTISRLRCGNGATMTEYYDLVPLDGSCVIPETPKVWYDMERARIRPEIQDEGFQLSENVKLGMLPRHRYLKNGKTSEIVGEGRLLLDLRVLSYTGTRNGQPFSFRMTPHDVPTYGMCTAVTIFYTFYRGEYHEFIPETESTAKWLLAKEEIHRVCGGRWRDFPVSGTQG